MNFFLKNIPFFHNLCLYTCVELICKNIPNPHAGNVGTRIKRMSDAQDRGSERSCILEMRYCGGIAGRVCSSAVVGGTDRHQPDPAKRAHDTGLGHAELLRITKLVPQFGPAGPKRFRSSVLRD